MSLVPHNISINGKGCSWTLWKFSTFPLFRTVLNEGKMTILVYIWYYLRVDITTCISNKMLRYGDEIDEFCWGHHIVKIQDRRHYETIICIYYNCIQLPSIAVLDLKSICLQTIRSRIYGHQCIVVFRNLYYSREIHTQTHNLK